MILEYFGDEEWADRGRRCNACDACDAISHGAAAGPIDDATKRSVERLLLLIGDLHGRFGRTRITALAIGSDDDPRFEEIPHRGCLRGWTQKDVMDLLRTLEAAGLVAASRGEYPTLSTTRKGDLAGLGKGDLGEVGAHLRLQASRAPARKARIRKRA
jgi:ATP-dependent DNA helicase RecQ